MSQSWHESRSTYCGLVKLYLAKAFFPRQVLKPLRKINGGILEDIKAELRKSGLAVNFVYTGSSYEDLKVGSTDMEFDVMVVLPGGKHLKEEVVRPGWAKLKPSKKKAKFATSCEPDGSLDPITSTTNFFGDLQKAVNNLPQHKDRIKLRSHGPAVQMDVHGDANHGDFLVDMVPAYQVDAGSGVTNGPYYIAKPFKGEAPKEGSWRRSFSLKEKKTLATIDKGHHCRKQCIRLLKVLRDSEPGLQPIVSYWIKTAIFNMDQELPELDWSQLKMGERFFDLLRYLAEALENGQLCHHYIPEINLLEDLTPIQSQNISSRLRELIRSKDEFNRALDRAKQD